MGIGRPPMKPENRRYVAAGRKPSVYLAEIGRMVKVGYSHRPDQRLMQLHKLHTRQGEFMGEFVVLRGLSEERCIEVLRRHASVVPRRREYFTGIQFSDALALLLDAFPAPHASHTGVVSSHRGAAFEPPS